MAMNPADLFKIKGAFDQFNANHPKFIPFFRAAGPKAKTVGSIIEISITDPNGEKIETNLKIKDSDIELFNTLLSMSGK